MGKFGKKRAGKKEKKKSRKKTPEEKATGGWGREAPLELDEPEAPAPRKGRRVTQELQDRNERRNERQREINARNEFARKMSAPLFPDDGRNPKWIDADAEGGEVSMRKRKRDQDTKRRKAIALRIARETGATEGGTAVRKVAWRRQKIEGSDSEDEQD